MGATTSRLPFDAGETGDETGPSAAFAAFLAGDTQAMRTLMDTFGSMMTAVARRYVRGHDVDDAVQDAWLAFTTSASSIRDPHAVGGWLRVTTMHAALAIAKRQSRMVPTDLTSDGPTAPDQAEHPLDDRDRQTVREAVSRLARRHRELLTLMFDNELSYEEIAARTGHPVGWIGPTADGRSTGSVGIGRSGALRRVPWRRRRASPSERPPRDGASPQPGAVVPRVAVKVSTS